MARKLSLCRNCGSAAAIQHKVMQKVDGGLLDTYRVSCTVCDTCTFWCLTARKAAKLWDGGKRDAR